MADQFFAAFAKNVGGAVAMEPADAAPAAVRAPSPAAASVAATAPSPARAPAAPSAATKPTAASRPPPVGRPAVKPAASATAHSGEGEGVVSRAEHVVEEAAHAVADVAREAEAETEAAAVRGFLGGPQVWALLAIIVGIALVVWFQ